MNLSEVADALEVIRSDLHRHGAAPVLELVKSEAPLNEIALFGNREGFLYLAQCCLSLAESSTPGAHYHFDRTSGLHRADMSLVIAHKLEPSP